MDQAATDGPQPVGADLDTEIDIVLAHHQRLALELFPAEALRLRACGTTVAIVAPSMSEAGLKLHELGEPHIGYSSAVRPSCGRARNFASVRSPSVMAKTMLSVAPASSRGMGVEHDIPRVARGGRGSPGGHAATGRRRQRRRAGYHLDGRRAINAGVGENPRSGR